ncbi:hypothetical protein PO124_15565 [Bacillus licheniformis]|nr:hypothetical protein [Bacillus licheniformis]
MIIVVLLGGLTACSAAALMFTSGYLISKAATRPEMFDDLCSDRSGSHLRDSALGVALC